MSNEFSEIEKRIIEANQLCRVYLLYFDEVLGHAPILVNPDQNLKDNEEIMRLIRIHPIWFLDICDKSLLARVDLEYKGKMYYAKKFLIPSKRIKRRSGSEKITIDAIVLILSLPIDLDIFGGVLIKEMTKRIIRYFKSSLSQLIESEIAKLNFIKTKKERELIEKGDALKNRIKALIKNTCSQYFQSVIKKSDATTLKIQRAIKGLRYISYIVNENKEKLKSEFNIEKQIILVCTNRLIKTQEIEIILRNKTITQFENIFIKVLFFDEISEHLIMYEKIDKWLPKEEILFIFPNILTNDKYIITLINDDKKTVLFQKCINGGT